MKLTKIKIEKLANEIVSFLDKWDMLDGTCIYYNNKRINDGKLEDGEFDPHNYFEWAAYDHILSMSFEGGLYHVLNYNGGSLLNKFDKIFEKYGLYYELGDSWNLTACVSDDDMEVEYTVYKKPQPRIHIYKTDQNDVPEELLTIVRAWKLFQEKIGDVGSCVLGAGFEFDYQGQPYFMSPCSRFQGSIAWETNINDIELLLKEIGAKNIYYDYGRMD